MARLMRSAGLEGVSPRKWTITTQQDKANEAAPDLVNRKFEAAGAQPALGGGHHVRADVGGVPLPGRRDRRLESPRRGLAHESEASRPPLVLTALDMAITRPPALRRHPPLRQGLPVHVDRLRSALRRAGIQPSTGSVGDAYDNALAESFFATLECELLDRVSFSSCARPSASCSSTSRAGTTRAGGTPPSATSHPNSSKRPPARRPRPPAPDPPRNPGHLSAT